MGEVVVHKQSSSTVQVATYLSAIHLGSTNDKSYFPSLCRSHPPSWCLEGSTDVVQNALIDVIHFKHQLLSFLCNGTQVGGLVGNSWNVKLTGAVFLLGTRVFRWLRLRNSIFYTIHVYAIFTDPWMVDFLWEIYQSHGSYGVRNQLKNTPESSTEAMNVGHWNWGPSKQKRQRSIYTPEN